MSKPLFKKELSAKKFRKKSKSFSFWIVLFKPFACFFARGVENAINKLKKIRSKAFYKKSREKNFLENPMPFFFFSSSSSSEFQRRCCVGLVRKGGAH
jgi:hypothetical protein